MGDLRRHDLFARFIATQVPDRSARIADVAAGKGYLSFALRHLGYRNVVPFEPAPRKGGQVTRLGMQARNFTPSLAAGFDVLVGMHPDEATDCILDAAATTGAKAIVCPCCAKPTAWAYWGAKCAYNEWVAHLEKQSARRGLVLRRDVLPMNGRSLVLVS